jgi:hypothetical protein
VTVPALQALSNSRTGQRALQLAERSWRMQTHEQQEGNEWYFVLLF